MSIIKTTLFWWMGKIKNGEFVKNVLMKEIELPGEEDGNNEQKTIEIHTRE